MRAVSINVNNKTRSVDKIKRNVLRVGWWSAEQQEARWKCVCVCCVLESMRVCPSMSLSSELTRGSLIRLKQSDDGRVALGTFNELLQRQSACGEQEIKKAFTVSSSRRWWRAESCGRHLLKTPLSKTTQEQVFKKLQWTCGRIFGLNNWAGHKSVKYFNQQETLLCNSLNYNIGLWTDKQSRNKQYCDYLIYATSMMLMPTIITILITRVPITQV